MYSNLQLKDVARISYVSKDEKMRFSFFFPFFLLMRFCIFRYYI